jgi:magnesium chelatase family protein
VKESVERVRSAVINSGYAYPDMPYLVNLAPADVKKEGPAFDLPIALGVLAGTGALAAENLNDFVIVGELALDGRIRPVNGVLSMAMTAAAAGYKGIVVPLENAAEAAVVQDIEVYAVGSLAQAVAFLSDLLPVEATCIDIDSLFDTASTYDVDFSDVKGQESVKRALTIAAAGGHNVMMIGPPGAGKTMLTKRMATILPNMSLAESLETTRVYSSVGLLPKGEALIATRPVRTPHHTASGPALIGGGTHPRPGELSLAHHGILFLDEFAEFPRNVLEMIRQPLEDGTVTISRAKGTLCFPAQFMMLAAMNPCPCGYFGTNAKRCAVDAHRFRSSAICPRSPVRWWTGWISISRCRPSSFANSAAPPTAAVLKNCDDRCRAPAVDSGSDSASAPPATRSCRTNRSKNIAPWTNSLK